jgi:hypothetical protein
VRVVGLLLLLLLLPLKLLPSPTAAPVGGRA